LEPVSLMISVSAVAQFSFIVFKTTGAWRALTNPCVTFEKCFIDNFPVGTKSVFVDISESTGAASALNVRFTFVRCFGEHF